MAASLTTSHGAGLSGDQPIEIRPQRKDYPREAELRGMDGFAKVVIEVDENGLLIDWMVTEASHEYFARGAGEIIRNATYRAAKVNGRAIPLRAEVPIEFKTDGITINTDFQTIGDLYLQGGHARNRAFSQPSLRELDGIPLPLTIDAPPFPAELAREGIVGSVIIDFYIDESGKVRMPAIASDSFEELGTLAREAVRKWRFEPPRCRGRAMAVRARQEFRFKEGSPVAE
ncbi:MAG: TonB family protein [Candidatus Synoicihabitans palmerolidicus]|nr:TonB family protein [Candidatus Synoicihabitans palmerolidicus]